MFADYEKKREKLRQIMAQKQELAVKILELVNEAKRYGVFPCK